MREKFILGYICFKFPRFCLLYISLAEAVLCTLNNALLSLVLIALPAQYNSFCYSANNVHIFAALIIYVGYTDGQDIATAISVFREKY